MLQNKAQWNILEYDVNIQTTEEEVNRPSPIIRKLLAQRGITKEGQMEEFLSPQLDYLHSPENFSMMEKALRRVNDAIENDEKILVYGDYDAGATRF